MKQWLLAVVCALLVGACAHPKVNTDALVLPQVSTPADNTATESWYQAEWSWKQHSVAFLTMLRPESDGSMVLLATTLTGQELFAVQQHPHHFSVLYQDAQTKRIPLPYVYRDMAWATASDEAFIAMQAPANEQFQAQQGHKSWQQNGQMLWQAHLQADGAWLIHNHSAHYQLRLTPLTPNEIADE